MLLKEFLQKYNLSVQHFAVVCDRTLNNMARYAIHGDPMPKGLALFVEKITDGEVTREELLLPDKYPIPAGKLPRMSSSKDRKRMTRIRMIAMMQKALRIEEEIE